MPDLARVGRRCESPPRGTCELRATPSGRRTYLKQRGIAPDRIADADLGLMPSRDRLRLALLGACCSRSEIDASQLLADKRWAASSAPGATSPNTRTLWARSIDPDDEGRYLYLRSAQRLPDVPYGVSSLLASPDRDAQRQLVLVEGVLDVHTLRAHDVASVAALGCLAASRSLFERPSEVGVEDVVLALDNHLPGRMATGRAIDTAAHTQPAPHIRVVDPDLLGDTTDSSRTATRGSLRITRASASPRVGELPRALSCETDRMVCVQRAGARTSRLRLAGRGSGWPGRCAT